MYHECDRELARLQRKARRGERLSEDEKQFLTNCLAAMPELRQQLQSMAQALLASGEATVNAAGELQLSAWAEERLAATRPRPWDVE
jgi:hypothetical protein